MMFQYEAQVLRIVDGDTLWLSVDLGFKIHYQIDVRLAHINAPEIANFTLDGITNPAIIYINQCVPVGSTCVVEISRAEKYGRWLGTIFYLKGSKLRDEILRAGSSLNDELVARGYAKVYKS
jgi:micrococcal nuclease